jgi:hypothetical protein
MKLLAVAWFVSVALGVLGPLLLPGYLLLLDFPGGPRIPWVSPFPLPSQAFVSAGAPVISLLRSLALVVPEETPKLLIITSILVAGFGLFRFLSVCLIFRPIPALTGATLFAINPFVYDRALAGQLLILLAYAFLPWALPSLMRLTREGTTRALIWSLAWTAAIGIINLQIGGVALLLLLTAITSAPRTSLVKLGFLSGAVATLLVVNLYWILPLAASTTPHTVGSGDLAAYGTRPHSAAVLGAVLLLHGFWRLEFSTPLSNYPLIFLFSFIPLLAAAAAGVISAMTSERYRGPAAALGAAALVGLVLAMGTSFPPTAPISRFLFTNLPGYGLFREPQKWLALVALAYSVFTAAGLQVLAVSFAKWRRHSSWILLLTPLLPLIATHIMLWGFQGRVDVSRFPTGWAHAEAETASQSGKLLFLPWHLYEPLPFTQARIVANPAPSYFTIPTLVSTSSGLSTRDATAPTDPRTNYVSQLVSQPGHMKHFGHLMAPLGVHYIALANVADARSYRFLDRQHDLHRVFKTKSLSLYRNKAFRGSFYSLLPRRTPSSIRSLINSAPLQQRAGESLLAGPQGQNRAGISGPSWTRRLRFWPRFSAPRHDYVGTDLSCRDGWRFGESAPLCNLGTVAAFPPSTEGAMVLWRPGFGTQLIGYATSLIALLGLVAVCWRTRMSQIPASAD